MIESIWSVNYVSGFAWWCQAEARAQQGIVPRTPNTSRNVPVLWSGVTDKSLRPIKHEVFRLGPGVVILIGGTPDKEAPNRNKRKLRGTHHWTKLRSTEPDRICNSKQTNRSAAGGPHHCAGTHRRKSIKQVRHPDRPKVASKPAAVAFFIFIEQIHLNLCTQSLSRARAIELGTGPPQLSYPRPCLQPPSRHRPSQRRGSPCSTRCTSVPLPTPS